MLKPESAPGWALGTAAAPSAGWLTRAVAAPAGLPFLIGLGCVATALSVGLQGYFFAVVNNSYHIPIVEGWVDDPQFASDGFIQSLRYHTSYVWPLAQVLAGWLGTFDTFVLLHVANRFAMFVGMGLLIRELGVRTAAGVSAAVMSLAVTRYLLAASGPGDHDLFMPFLNHSSLTWPFLFASWLLLVRRQILLSLAMQGPVFAVNAFVAICGGPAVAGAALAFLPPRGPGRSAFLWRWLTGIGLAGIIAAPTAAWIVRSFLDQPAADPFSFIGFLKSYYTKHWFIAAAAPTRLISFVVVSGCGAACLALLGPRARCLVWVWCGYFLVFAAGAALPLLADSRLLLDLHPMRVGAGCVVMLSVVAIVAYLGQAMECAAAPAGQRAAASLALLCFAVGQAALLVMAAMVAFVAAQARMRGRPAGARTRPLPRLGAGQHAPLVLLAAGLLAVSAWRGLREPPPYDVPLLAAARDAGLWIREHSPPGSMIWVPSGAVPGNDEPVSVWARRPVWWDWKEGAAVMWTPHYHQEWSTRRSEVMGLQTVADAVGYACRHRIAYVVETTDRLRDEAARRQVAPAVSHVNDKYAVLRMAALCPGGG